MLDVMDIYLDNGEASTFGGQMLFWAPPGVGSVLWVSPLARRDGSAAVRGGIPVCTPWFARSGESPVGVPGTEASHGHARVSEWTVEESGPRHAALSLALPPSSSYPAALDIRLEISETLAQEYHEAHSLQLRATLTNRSEEPHLCEFAFHTYLACGDVREVQLAGFAGAEVISARTPVPSVIDGVPLGSVIGEDGIDVVYRTAGPIELYEAGRLITVEGLGTRDTIVWNPWEKGSAGMADVPADGWKNFLCVESGSVRDDAFMLEPGVPMTLGTQITVRRHWRDA